MADDSKVSRRKNKIVGSLCAQFRSNTGGICIGNHFIPCIGLRCWVERGWSQLRTLDRRKQNENVSKNQMEYR